MIASEALCDACVSDGAFVAGLLSFLSPCVLLVLPLVFAPAGAAYRFGALALAAGPVTSFVVIDLFVATIGFSQSDWTAAWCAMWRPWRRDWSGSCC